MTLHVALPLGIGDCHWVCQKLRGLSALHDNRPIRAYVNSSQFHESVEYLKLVPFVERAYHSRRAPFSLMQALPPSYKARRWSRLECCRDWQGFDYILSANGHLERGERIETWLPELSTEYSYPLNITPEDRAQARTIVPDNAVLLYLSGIGPNIGFHNNTFTPWHWISLILLLNEAGIVPYIIGANTDSDREYARAVLALSIGVQYHDRVGATTIPQICDIIQRASVWVGLNCGLGILAASQGTPTIMFWADKRWPVGVAALHPNQQRSWLSAAQLTTYRTFSYGDPSWTTVRVVEQLLEIRR